jgi:FHS family L-fucose permease-like MFS transporter
MQVSNSAGTTTQSPADKNVPIFPAGQMVAFGLISLVFFLWGMNNNLTDILVQQFKKSFELTTLKAQLVSTSNFLAYGMMAIPAALLTRRFGYKGGILIGLCTFATGTLLFYPAAIIGTYTPFLIALFVAGCGASILETACNPFMAQFGDPRTSESRLNAAQALNPPGTIAGLLIGTWFIFSGVEKSSTEVATMKAAGTYQAYLHSEIMRVVPTYVGFGIVILLVAFAISRVRFPSNLDAAADDGPQGSFKALLHYPHFMLAVLTMFLYIGGQIGTWSNLILYFKQYTGVSEKTAGYLLTISLVSLAVGRFVTTPLMRYISPAKITGVYGLINVVLCAIGAMYPGFVGGWALLATSFFMSVMFPTIFALGVKGLGPNTKIGGSFLVMAILGGAIFPLVMGAIKDHTGSLAVAYWIPSVCFFPVFIYGFFCKEAANVHDVNLTPEVM